MQIRCQHNDRVGQDVRRIGAGKESQTVKKNRNSVQSYVNVINGRVLSVAFTVSGSEFLHEPINFLSFTWQPETFQELAQGADQILVGKIEQIDVRVHHLKEDSESRLMFWPQSCITWRNEVDILLY